MDISLFFAFIAYTLLSYFNCRNSTIGMINEIGINTDKRSPKLIVSLTSFPERMYEIHYTI